MSVNVYLNAEKLKQVVGYADPDGNGLIKFRGCTLFPEGNHYYLMSTLEAGVRDFLVDAVEGFSVYATTPNYQFREPGVYRHESAVAEVNIGDPGGKNGLEYRLKIKAKTLEDARELIHLFRTGAIRPEESFDTPQGGKSRRELEDELELTQLTLKVVEGNLQASLQMNELVSNLRQDLVRAMQVLRNDLRGGLPVCRTKSIIKYIDKALALPNK